MFTDVREALRWALAEIYSLADDTQLPDLYERLNAAYELLKDETEGSA